MDSCEGKEYVRSHGLLADGEWEVMIVGDRHTTVFFWIASELARLADAKTISEERLSKLMESIASMRGQANDVSR